jgi:uncharacterized damage-inducible protein DinB
VSDDHRTPWTIGDERETLLAFLDYLRTAVVRKVDRLPDALARRSPVGSGTSLLGLVKHLTRVEVAWFHWGFAGDDVRVPEDALSAADSVDAVVGGYRAAVAASNRIVDACPDLSTRCRRALAAPEPMTLRWVLVHLVEETGRHAGHADILREQLDGSVGR